METLETFGIIHSFMEPKEILETRVVSRYWNHVITSSVYSWCETVINIRKVNIKNPPKRLIPMLRNFKCEEVTDDKLSDLEKFINTTRLVLINSPQVTNNGLKVLNKFERINYLKFERCNGITNLSMNLLSLKSLEISDCENISNNIMDAIIKFTNLKKLKLISCERITRLSIPNSVSYLSLKGCVGIPTYGLRDLSRHTKLCVLDLSFTQINDDALKSIEKLTLLKKLNLSFCKNITNKGLQFISNLRLNELNISQCNLSENCLKYLSKMTSLRLLYLNRIGKITNKGLKYLSNLTSLLNLELNDCSRVTNYGLRFIKNLKNLQTLTLDNCKKITNDGLKHISNCRHLKKLSLHKCDKITDHGLKKLISKLKKLQLLRLTWAPKITEKVITLLDKLKYLTLEIHRCDKFKINSSDFERIPKGRLHVMGIG